MFKEFSGEVYNNFSALAEKLRSDYEFGHTLDAKLLPRGDSSVSGPVVRLFKPFDELFVDFEVYSAFSCLDSVSHALVLGSMDSKCNTEVIMLAGFSCGCSREVC